LLLIASYPDVQKKMREEITRVWPDLDKIQSSSYREDFPKFEYTLAVFRESMRVFPPEPRIDKIVQADTVVSVAQFTPTTEITTPSTSFDGGLTNVTFKRDPLKDTRIPVQVPKDSIVVVDIWGVHMNPLHWGEDAHMFRPERFIDTETYKWPRDAYQAFSAGPRGCLGQRFALAESICILASIIRRYEVLLPEKFAGATTEEARRRLFTWTTGITLTPTNTFVRFRKID